MTTARDKFLSLLRDDILKLDLAELDFGIYRILNYRRREIEAFLERDLPQQIDAALAKRPGAPGEDEQGRIFHHLYTFFSRYYDDGDFVTRPRRGRSAAYSVPYNGQDVHFWWATKGSHYVKSGERFGAYVWHDGSRRIRIEVVAADIEKDNVKGAKRYYLPESIDEAEGELRVKLLFRPLEKDEARLFERKANAADGEDEADDDDAIEGRSAQDRILNAWFDGNGPRKAKIPGGIDKGLLRKHVNRYVAGQSSDFFVHPQLGDFLTGELDYYLKNEFLEIWDRTDGEALARERGKFGVVRDIGRTLIAFLAAIEDVQAQLFEKRKFVLESHWLARVSAIPEGRAVKAIIDEACANADQVNEWLGWLGQEALKGRAVSNPAKRGAELLASYPHLCIHTKHFDADFKHRLLALFEDIDGATGGTLLHCENYAALRTLEAAYKRRVRCVYIDPPYNAPGTSEIPYKNEFPHSSWATLMEDRLKASLSLMEENAVLVAAIDENEEVTLRQVLSAIRPSAETHSIPVVHNPRGVQGDNFSYCHELAVFSIEKGAKVIDKLSVPQEEWEYSNLRNWGGASERKDGWEMFYPLVIRKGKVIDAGESLPRTRSPKARVENRGGDIHLWPIDSKGVERKWRYSRKSVKDLFPVLRVVGEGSETEVEMPRTKDAVKTVWKAPEFDAGVYGSKILKVDLGLDGFRFPKSLHLVKRCVQAVRDETRGLTVLDYFGGSGTTGHAVIALNREDGGHRRFVLVEQGEYFDTVMLPRVAKIIACPEWKDGSPKDGVAMKGKDEHWSVRSPALVRVLRLECYEDSLDALELPSEAAARRAGQMSFAGESMLRYVYEASAGKTSVALNHAQLSRPFDLKIPQHRHGAPVLVDVDLASSALLLLGLHPVRLRDLARKDKIAKRYLFVEARPNGKPKERHLVILRDCDDALTGDAARVHAVAEADWIVEAVRRELGAELSAYQIIWYNRDAVLPSTNGRSLDPEVIRRMMERAPAERVQ